MALGRSEELIVLEAQARTLWLEGADLLPHDSEKHRRWAGIQARIRMIELEQLP